MNKYDDIINMKHHTSAVHPHMSMHDRAAQFAPFAALTGHSALIRETARLTSKRIILDDYAIEELNARLIQIAGQPNSETEYSITYFIPDIYKDGGDYVTVSDKIKSIDPYSQMILTVGGTRINIGDVIDISDSPCVNTDF